MKSDHSLHYITDDKGTRISVILPIDDYQKILNDLEHLAVIAERRDECRMFHIDVINRLKSSGKL